MYGKNKTLNAPSDLHAKDKFVYKFFFFLLRNSFITHRLNLYVYEYLYHIGASKAAQGFCADVSKILNFFNLN
jgi:hypothetical protein